jgi:hypothetical protein
MTVGDVLKSESDGSDYDAGLETLKDALLVFQTIESLKLPKGTRLIGGKSGIEVHRKDGVSYRVIPIAPAQQAASTQSGGAK